MSDVFGGCGDEVCAARVEVARLLPRDRRVLPPCPRCAEAAAEQADRAARR